MNDAVFERAIYIPDEPCHIWRGRKDPRGYARYGGRCDLAHRIAYEREHGPIPEGKELHHTCGVKHCVNPAHLQALTREEHVKAEMDLKTHCPHGHEMTPENTYLSQRDGRERRDCRTCTLERRKRYLKRIKEAA